MPPAVAIAGAAVVGAGAQIISGNKAAKAQQQAADQQVAESRRQYDQDRADLAPWRAAGQSALSKMSAAYGLNGQPAATPEQLGFTTSPGYQFRLDQGVQAAERSAAARGLLGSGAAMKAVQRYGEGLAASEYGDWWNRLAGIAGVGQAATNTTVAAGQNATNGITSAIGAAGNARASSYANTGSAINSGLNNIMGAYLYNRGWGSPGTKPGM